LQIGRVDLSDMPAFSLSEKELLRQYLNKDHNFRHKRLNVERRGLIVDAFGVFNGEAFASSGWRNFAPLFGVDNVTSAASGQFISTLTSQNFLWAYGCGPGTYTSATGIGTTDDFAANDVRAVFTMFFGSYFGDWDSQNNLMRAVLASPTHGLTASWGGRPHWFIHHMGLGEPIGYSAALSQTNVGTYQPLNFGAGEAHIALMGDPTLRLHSVAPPSALTSATDNGLVMLNWVPSSDSVLGYNVYRASSSAGPFARLNETRILNTTFNDTGLDPGQYVYEVRAETLEICGSGSYHNLSQGVFAVATVTRAPRPFPIPSPTLSVIALDADASEVGPDPGTFTIRLSASLAADLTITLELGGSANRPLDYFEVPTTLTIPAGETELTVRILPIPDTLVEGSESVTLAVTPNPAFSIDPDAALATIAVADGPVLQKLKVRRR
jgi:hypothetical protein